jgi:hypothetical protein
MNGPATDAGHKTVGTRGVYAVQVRTTTDLWTAQV